MYNFSNKIKSIKRITVCNNSLYSVSNEGVLSQDFYPVNKKVDVNSINFNKIGITYKDNLGRKIFSDGKTFEVPSRVFTTSLDKSMIVTKSNWRRSNGRFEFELGVFDYINNIQKIISNYTNYSIVATLNDFYIATLDKRFITLFEKHSLKKIWEIDSSYFLNETFFSKYFGCTENKLIFSDDKHTVFVLHKETGEIINTFSELPGINPGTPWENKILSSQGFVLDKKRQLLFGVFGKSYTEIDLKNNTISFKDLKPIVKKSGINFLPQNHNNNPFTTEHLFFSGIKEVIIDEKVRVLSCLVAFNRKTLDVDWEYTFDLNEGSTTTIVPLLTDDKLFQLTSNGNLYIFQKDKTNI